SAYSLKSLTQTLLPLMPEGGSVVALDFDAAQAWPAYDWMGVAKAALEATTRYLARDLGPRRVRVNLVAAGPLRTLAARSIPHFDAMEDAWAKRAPLGWDVRDPEPVARACVALLSAWFPATTGEIVHVDGGAHATALSPAAARASLDAAARARAGAPRLGRARPRAGRPGLRRAAVGLVPGHDRRDRPRRRGCPRDRPVARRGPGVARRRGGRRRRRPGGHGGRRGMTAAPAPDADRPAGDPVGLLPHRPPFRFVDAVDELVPGERVVA